jgi:hypothetical protein
VEKHQLDLLQIRDRTQVARRVLEIRPTVRADLFRSQEPRVRMPRPHRSPTTDVQLPESPIARFDFGDHRFPNAFGGDRPAADLPASADDRPLSFRSPIDHAELLVSAIVRAELQRTFDVRMR